MKKILLTSIILLLSFQLFAGFFDDKPTGATKSKDVTDIISVKTDDGNWVFFPKDKLVLLLTDDTVVLGYGESEKEIVSYPFKSVKLAKMFIESIYPDYSCLTEKGLVKCKTTKQLKIEEEKD